MEQLVVLVLLVEIRQDLEQQQQVVVEVVQMVDILRQRVVQVVVRVETEAIIMVPVPQVKDLEVVQLEEHPVHLPVVVEVPLKLGMTVHTIVVPQEQGTFLKVEMV